MAKYRVQRDGDVETIDEQKLRKKLRSNDLTGLELVRREDDESWVPLCDTRLFRDEVPFRGHPRDAARRREVQGFLGHVTAWAIVAAIMAALGSWLPFWLLIWGIFVVLHGVKVVPSTLGLLRTGQLLAAPARVSLPDAVVTDRPAIGAPRELGGRLADEVAQVRTLLDRRDDEEGARLLREVEQLVAALEEIARRRADLESQLSPDLRLELQKAREDTTQRLHQATTDQDRDFFRKEIEAVALREEAVEHAQRTLARWQSQERVAEHQLKQLRLDLSQAEARTVDVPDFAGRLEAIRLEAAAFEEIEDALAGRPRVSERS